MRDVGFDWRRHSVAIGSILGDVGDFEEFIEY